MMEAVDREDERDAEGPHDLDPHAELGDAAHDPGAGDIERGLDREEGKDDEEDRRVVRRIPVRAEPVV